VKVLHSIRKMAHISEMIEPILSASKYLEIAKIRLIATSNFILVSYLAIISL
jgi:hypothetical protein